MVSGCWKLFILYFSFYVLYNVVQKKFIMKYIEWFFLLFSRFCYNFCHVDLMELIFLLLFGIAVWWTQKGNKTNEIK